MTRWIHTINTKDLLGDYPCPPASEVREKSSTIVKRFNIKVPEDERSMGLFNTVEEFEYLSKATGDTDQEMVDAFNYCLEALYDACDRDRIWLGV